VVQVRSLLWPVAVTLGFSVLREFRQHDNHDAPLLPDHLHIQMSLDIGYAARFLHVDGSYRGGQGQGTPPRSGRVTQTLTKMGSKTYSFLLPTHLVVPKYSLFWLAICLKLLINLLIWKKHCKKYRSSKMIIFSVCYTSRPQESSFIILTLI